jgi:hypothetical protein
VRPGSRESVFGDVTAAFFVIDVRHFDGIELDRVARRRPSLWLFGWRQALFSLAGGQ